LHGEAVFTAPSVHEAHMGDALKIGVVNAEDISWPWNRIGTGAGVQRSVTRAFRCTLLPHHPFFRKQRRAPRGPWLGISSLPMAPAHEGRAPGIALVQPAVAEVFRYAGAVVAARGFLGADFGEVDFAQGIEHG